MTSDPLEVGVRCPTCGRRGAWFTTPYGPFCSHRCKLIDLGKWLGEEHAISEPLNPSPFEHPDERPPGEPLEAPDGSRRPNPDPKHRTP